MLSHTMPDEDNDELEITMRSEFHTQKRGAIVNKANVKLTQVIFTNVMDTLLSPNFLRTSALHNEDTK